MVVCVWWISGSVFCVWLVVGFGFWLVVGCGFCLVGYVVLVGYRAQQCDLNPDLLRVLEDGYVSKCCVVWHGLGLLVL